MKSFALGFACIIALSSGAMAETDPTEIKPIPQLVKVNEAKAELGERLYHDKQLSVDGTVACASCHMLDRGGVDKKRVSDGVNGGKGGVNSPTVYNSAHNFVQFWDGRAQDLKEQALGPVETPWKWGRNGTMWSKKSKRINPMQTPLRRFMAAR